MTAGSSNFPPKPKSRPKTAARGYGAAHQRLRRQWAWRVAAGGVCCARCGELIWPGEPWHLGHVDGDRSRYQGPEHERCNCATAAHAVERRACDVLVRADWW